MANKIRLRLGPLGVGINLVAVAAVNSTTEKAKETNLKVICVGGGDTGKPDHLPVKIKQMNRCPSCEFEAGGYTKFARGHVNDDGTITPLTQAQLDALKVEKVLTIALDLHRHRTSEVVAGTVPTGKFYYLVPSDADAASYPMFVELIRSDTEYSYCTMYAVRTSPSMWRLGTLGDVLILQEMADPAEVKALPLVAAYVPEQWVKEMPLARQVAQMLTEPFDAQLYANTRREALAQELAAAEALQSGEASDEAAPIAGKIDLMSALQASVKAAATGKPVLVKPRRSAPEPSDPGGTVKHMPTPATAVAPATPKRTRAKKAS